MFGCLCWCWIGCCWTVGTVDLVAGNAGIGGVLPGRGVPLLTLKHVSPVQGSPPRILFCCLVSSVWYASSMFSVLPLLLLTIVLLKFSNLSVGTGHRWSGTKNAFRCVSLVAECPEVIFVTHDFHACWCQGHWCDLCCCSLGRLMYFQLHVGWNVYKLHRQK